MSAVGVPSLGITDGVKEKKKRYKLQATATRDDRLQRLLFLGFLLFLRLEKVVWPHLWPCKVLSCSSCSLLFAFSPPALGLSIVLSI